MSDRSRSCSRRDCLRGALALGSLAAWPTWATPRARGRTLVLIQLAGGNDGLNTVIPWRDGAYRTLRPALAPPEDALLRLSDRVALHPSLEPLLGAWRQGDLAVVEGVGYERPNRSHFSSTDVWHAGARQARSSGWVGALLAASARDPSAVADAITLSEDGEAALTAEGVRTLSLARPGKWLTRAASVPVRPSRDPGDNPSLRHLLATERDIVSARERLREQLRASDPGKPVKGARRMGAGVRLATRLLTGDFGLRALHLKVGGFDTHANQPVTHKNLLQGVARGLASLREQLIAAGAWNDVVVMTYSEFGRRAKENGSRGTDHGKAGPMFIMGGGIKGGLFGQQPSLTDLDDGDLRHHVDFRQVYATVARDLLGYPSDVVQDVLGRHKRLGFAA
jgi:uncharacterized protein (DUF1501 family)